MILSNAKLCLIHDEYSYADKVQISNSEKPMKAVCLSFLQDLP